MTTTERILTTFTSKVEMDKEYTRSELAKMLTEVFKEIRENSKGEKKTRMKVYSKGGDGGEEKKKREPTLYNKFIKETLPIVKINNPNMSRQDLMREVGRMWNTNKSPKSPKSIKRMIDKNYPELNSIQKQKLLDNLLKTSIYWKM